MDNSLHITYRVNDNGLVYKTGVQYYNLSGYLRNIIISSFIKSPNLDVTTYLNDNTRLKINTVISSNKSKILMFLLPDKYTSVPRTSRVISLSKLPLEEIDIDLLYIKNKILELA